jgi:Anti-sigma factor NepR
MLGAGGRAVFDDLMGRNLQSVYQEVLSEPIPERFRRLLDWLDANHRGP